ncbi:hypothetical protein BGZ76_009681 [Entomortierella beljakovae]|nr:hypothetical protein BGZ76_009681 [Entomortierella beljakovae]
MPPPPRRGNGSKLRQTYGRQRSFLDQEGEEEEEEEPKGPQSPPLLLKRGSSDMNIQPPLKRSSSGIRPDTTAPSISRTTSHQSMESIDENKEKETALKASHELREAGQNHKFKDEIEYIIDGIRTKDRRSIHRTSCIELTRSMLESEFMTQVKAHHYFPTVFEIIYNDEDPIVISCLALMLEIMIRDTQASKDILCINGVLEFLCHCLEMDMDPMSTMPSGRQEITMYNEFKDLARRSGIIQKGQKVLTKSIVLSTMAFIIKESVASKDEQTLKSIDQVPEFLSIVFELLIDDLAWIKQPVSTPDVSLPDVLDISRIENCLLILERYSLVSRRPAMVLLTNRRLFPLLVQVVTLCRAHAFQFPQYTDSMSLMLHVLQLLINITNGEEACCEALSQSGSIHVLVQNIIQFYCHCRNYNPDETRYGTIACGVKSMDAENGVVNWEAENTTIPTSFKIENDANGCLNCKAIGDCFHKVCQCEQSLEALEQLVEIYNVEITVSEMTENQVLAAYLALLIGSIVGGNTDAESRLYNSVNGRSLVPMLELLNEFVAFNETVQVEYFGVDIQDDNKTIVTRTSMLELSEDNTTSNNNNNNTNNAEDQEGQTSIYFMASKASETQDSFFQIIGILKDIEKRFSS